MAFPLLSSGNYGYPKEQAFRIAVDTITQYVMAVSYTHLDVYKRQTVCSAFKKESGLLEYLTEKGEKDVMVCGIMTDFCINATVEAGFEHGLHMIVPAYANSTQNNEYMTGEQSYRCLLYTSRCV